MRGKLLQEPANASEDVSRLSFVIAGAGVHGVVARKAR
jgi:hypothetical protein